ncbi:MAG: hypothetical protein JXA92_08945 [candidate division Zixibacteria bacterium]|nr:hypothetical protein [candidate division Zixibacteria bacterium]
MIILTVSIDTKAQENAATLPPLPATIDSESRPHQDLLLFGFGELIMHSWGVKGNIKAFELNNSSFKDDFSSNYRTSLFANGNLNKKFFIDGVAVLDSRIDDEYRNADPSLFRMKMSVKSTEPLWDSWRFTGETVYDPNHLWEFGNLDTRLLYQPQEPARLELLARLESDEHGYIDGGSLRPSFKDSKFTLYQRSLFGGYADVYSGPVGVEAVGGKLEGKTFREGAVVGIRADGTTGPFDLQYAPVTRGSETVKIETRDRFNESTVLSSRTLNRDQDYTVDYERGRIILYQPVSSETMASDPVYIVITYDYQRYENDELIGGRARVMPSDNGRASVSYLHRIVDDNATGAGIDEPEDLMAADAKFDMKEYGKAYVEVAGSENPNIDETNSAFRAGWEGSVVSGLNLKAVYQRVEDQYRSFGNTDLNPTKNQRRLQLAGSYDLTEDQTLSASFNQIRGLEANGEFNTYAGRRDEKIYGLGYQNQLSDNFRFGVNVERRDVENADDPSTEDNYQNRLIIDASGKQDSVIFLDRFYYGLHYEYIAKRNNLSGGTGNTNGNQIAVSLAGEPSQRTRLELTQKLRLLNDRDLDLYTERVDATFASARYQPRDDLSTKATLEYKRYTAPGDKLSFWEDDPTKIERSGTIALEYIPVEKVKGLAKAGRYEIEQWWYDVDSTSCSTNDFVLAQATYFYSHHLSFNAESEYTRRVIENNSTSREKIWDLGLRVNWNKNHLNEFTAGLVRRWQLSDYLQVKELTSTSYIILVNGSIGLGYGLFARASVKDYLLRDLFEDEKTHIILEAGYENARWYRVSLGFERIESQPDELFPDNYYRGQGVFIRLVGKF